MGGAESIIINRLIRWARWKLNSGVSLGYPSQVSFTRLIPCASVHDAAFDSECIDTNRAVDSLPLEHYDTIRYEYITSAGLNQDKKADQLRISVSTYRRRVKRAHRQMAINLNISSTQTSIREVEMTI
jgi:hypothetical protein